MAERDTPKSRATARAERRTIRAATDLLRQQIRDEQRARNGFTLWSRERGQRNRRIRELKEELRKLRG